MAMAIANGRSMVLKTDHQNAISSLEAFPYIYICTNEDVRCNFSHFGIEGHCNHYNWLTVILKNYYYKLPVQLGLLNTIQSDIIKTATASSYYKKSCNRLLPHTEN